MTKYVLPFDLLNKAGGPYIGPKGGKWADPQHTIPWKEDNKRTGVMAIDHKHVTQIINNLLEGSSAEQNKVTYIKPNNLTSWIKDPSGKKVKVEISIVPTTQDRDFRGVDGVAQQVARVDKKGRASIEKVVVNLYIDSKRNWTTETLPKILRNVLSHELTHAIDPSISKQGLRELEAGVTKDKLRMRAKDQSPKEYYNNKQEVTARLQQIARDILDNKTYTEIKEAYDDYQDDPEDMPRPYRAPEVASWSRTWQVIKEHATPVTEKRVLKTVASIINQIEQGNLDPITKSSSIPKEFVRTNAGDQAPGPGLGVNFYIPVPKRDTKTKPALTKEDLEDTEDEKPKPVNKRDKEDYDFRSPLPRKVTPIVLQDDYGKAQAEAREDAIIYRKRLAQYSLANSAKPNKPL
jgi:hypothetical protein